MVSKKIWCGRIRFNRGYAQVFHRPNNEQKEIEWKITLKDLWHSRNNHDYFMAVLILIGMIETAREWRQRNSGKEFTFIISRNCSSARCGGILVARQKVQGNYIQVPIAVNKCREWSEIAFSVLNIPFDSIIVCLSAGQTSASRIFTTLARNNVHLPEDKGSLEDLRAVYGELMEHFEKVKVHPSKVTAAETEDIATVVENAQRKASDGEVCEDRTLLRDPADPDGNLPEMGQHKEGSDGECRKQLVFAQ